MVSLLFLFCSFKIQYAFNSSTVLIYRISILKHAAEIYSDIVFDDTTHASAAALESNRDLIPSLLAIVSGVSKGTLWYKCTGIVCTPRCVVRH
jgi:hypothetical protein